MGKEMIFVRAVKARMTELDWTAYRLAKECKDQITAPTIYAFLDGKPVKSDSLAVILDAVNLTISPKR